MSAFHHVCRGDISEPQQVFKEGFCKICCLASLRALKKSQHPDIVASNLIFDIIRFRHQRFYCVLQICELVGMLSRSILNLQDLSFRF